ncbi:NAD kinase [Aquisalinus flavus]|uniref:NAD kinase n=1 Tax=Aquisalinus flavus TaxID=1526572 RepID=A0A8J2V491_9PROT|nr:NAD kinase [Aquisalinus flavus]MBD0427835.1 NAD kinase [Aquisalinus flavus]UNE47602.1 NAD kinase [Aquisalinus flavus]GGD04211.1 NAD kinase [Aquisalinus flavus]
MDSTRIAFLASDKPEAQEALQGLAHRYGNLPVEAADIIAPIGGDGFMLETLKAYMGADKPIYGINRGTVGFLMNSFSIEDLPRRIANAEAARIRPLEMTATDRDGAEQTAIAFNEISLLRETRQTARIAIHVNGKTRMDMLICDGILLSSPIGSTAYNLSAHGPIIPIGAKLLALTPISAFRPRRWRGALLPHDAEVSFEILEPGLRPVSAVADNYEVRRVSKVTAVESRHHVVTMLYDNDHSLEERIVREQFSY